MSKIIFDERRIVTTHATITIQSIIVYNGAHYMTYDLNIGICFNDDENDRFNMDQIFKKINFHDKQFRPVAMLLESDPIISNDIKMIIQWIIMQIIKCMLMIWCSWYWCW